MKKILLLAFVAISLTASSKAVIIGNSAGYLLDQEKSYLTARIGGQFAGTSVRHVGEFEVGYTSDSEFGVKTTLAPLTANYRAELGGDRIFGGYLGFGFGMAHAKVDSVGVRAEEWLGFAQGFGGVSLKVSKRATVTVGARYIRLYDTESFDARFPIGDDTVIEAGFSFRF